MSEKRKDNKGRILRTGESQRKDLIYQYRYTDIRGKRQTVYSSDLKELREKEKEIQKQLDEGIDYAAGKATVIALVERYISLKQGVRYNTKVGYNFVLNLIKKEDFGYRQIRDIRVSDAQKWIINCMRTVKATVPLPVSGALSNRRSKWLITRTLSAEIPLISNW